MTRPRAPLAPRLGNVTMRESAMQRVLFERSRLTGLDVAGCSLRNVRVTGVPST